MRLVEQALKLMQQACWATGLAAPTVDVSNARGVVCNGPSAAIAAVEMRIGASVRMLSGALI